MAEKADFLPFLSLPNTYLISCDPPVHYCINFHYSLIDWDLSYHSSDSEHRWDGWGGHGPRCHGGSHSDCQDWRSAGRHPSNHDNDHSHTSTAPAVERLRREGRGSGAFGSVDTERSQVQSLTPFNNFFSTIFYDYILTRFSITPWPVLQ